MNAAELDEIICGIYTAELGDNWSSSQTDDPSEEKKWRDHLKQHCIPHLEEVQEGQVWFTLPAGHGLP